MSCIVNVNPHKDKQIEIITYKVLFIEDLIVASENLHSALVQGSIKVMTENNNGILVVLQKPQSWFVVMDALSEGKKNIGILCTFMFFF